MVGGEAAPEWAGVEAERRGQLDGEVEWRHGNGGGCGSRAREQKLASAFMGKQEEERGWAHRSWGRTGSSGRAGSSHGARPVAVVAERGVRGWSSEGGVRTRVGW